MLSLCGVSCGECKDFKQSCAECRAISGKVYCDWWVASLVQIFVQCMTAPLTKKALNIAATVTSSLVRFIMLLKTLPPPTRSI